MTLKQYIKFRKKTKLAPIVSSLSYLGLGIAGESGEVADEIKKMMRDHSMKQTLDSRKNIILELGDVMWYWVGLCEFFNIKPEEVMELNKKKLTKRYLNK